MSSHPLLVAKVGLKELLENGRGFFRFVEHRQMARVRNGQQSCPWQRLLEFSRLSVGALIAGAHQNEGWLPDCFKFLPDVEGKDRSHHRLNLRF